MKKITTLALLLILLGSFNLSAQRLSSKKYLNNTFTAYNKELQLSPEKATKFKDILKRYNAKIATLVDAKKDNPQSFNKLVKLQDIEIFKLLDGPQFTIYKKEKAIIEPAKKYRR
ncbi:hypothetical protein RQM59_14345 [Flavobacteriaceae bacterium S356]|uniref:Inhibitor I9 domain-containing protein n=1 Tax=Asprobacillus argus TaxID=3076534 RepID=A0ABU3LKG0_9FLAO|nr:hypothetical protein [Flavobacteriaceae bacterium S356]